MRTSRLIQRSPIGKGLLFAGALTLALTSGAAAAEHEVKMLNRGEAGIMVFEPAFLEIAPGDTVHFRAVDKGHNTASIDDMVPEGGPSWKGGLNKDVTVTRVAATETTRERLGADRRPA